MQPIRYCADTLHRLWASGESYQAIAAALGCSESFVHKLKVRHKLPDRQKPTREIFADDPTPAQIAEACAGLRAKHLAELRSSNPRVVEVISTARCFGWNGYKWDQIA